jgi:hypothetical protein
VWNDHLDGENASGNRLRDSRWRDAIVHNPLVTAIRRNLVPQAWRDRIKKGWQMAAKPMLGAQALARVTAVFDEDLTLLGDMLGTRLTCATFKSVVSERALEWSKSPRPL